MKNWRLITYNIHKGVGPFGKLSMIERVRLSLLESKADFLLLQEVVGERQESTKKFTRHLEELADERWPHHAYGKNAVFPTKNHGNAILSSVPIVKVHNKDLSVYSVEKRGLLHAELEWEKPGLHLCTCHLDLFEYTRKKQVERLIGYLKEHVPKNAPLILGGDFNDWAEKVGHRLADALGLEELSQPSFPAWHPILRLDRLYHRGIKVTKFEALQKAPWNRMSDHLPLMMEFQLKKK